MTSPRRTAIVVRTPQDIVDEIDARLRAKQNRTPDRTVTRNEVVVSILRVGLKRSVDVVARETRRPPPESQ